MRYLLLLNLFAFSVCFAQNDTINQRDSEGRKQGWWISYGKDDPSLGYPSGGKIREGAYLDDRKHGIWIRYHDDGVTPKLVGRYERNRPNGDYRKIYPNGEIREYGTWTNNRYVGYRELYYESGCLKSVAFYNDEGKQDGWVNSYYDDCTGDSIKGQIESRYELDNGKRIDTSFTYYPNGDLKEMTVPGSKRTQWETIKFERIHPAKELKEPSQQIRGCVIGPHFNPNGYNKLFNDQDNLWMEGDFKDGKLFNGTSYRYKVDGSLLAILTHEEGVVTNYSFWGE